ncbi:MAG TPA: GLPGLI family protein [Agriterribacter sp.]|nr:GLPGLI family protein [Agriterribacter sp.]
MKNFTLLLCAIVCASLHSPAQFISKGKIEFEKRVNQHKQMDMEDDGWAAAVKKQTPEYRNTYFNLIFSPGKAIYEPGRESNEKAGPWGNGPATENTVFTDFTNHRFVASKQVFDQAFLIQDSVRHFNWKITNDTRIIAGFECRRATAVIMDSVFVVAFYTNEIIASGGPESFNGLPGMILGVVIPRMFTSWYATKLELEDVNETSLTPPRKGKKTDLPGLSTQIQKSLKDWGKWGQKYIWQIMI